ncbi:uncharacterized protein LOC113398727 [Vanessa tameamea]|uniref:Uncharacterized protein LOC113398727 n=1 Tax=Vanessa tameamea TaxID=334116 RepID=A0ABM4AP53_VANTA
MKTLLYLCLFVYTATAVPLKHDEVNYPRFVKLSDNDDVMQTVDLEEQPDTTLLEDIYRNPDNNRYLLYTRDNPLAPQTLHLNNTFGVFFSKFHAWKPTVVIAHGWLSDRNTEVNIALTDAILRKSNVNVIVMEWRRLALSSYITAVTGVPAVGRRLGQFLEFLHRVTGAPFESMHLIGYSLGAHVVGNAGRELGGRVARITGLDPAGPLWNLNSNRLRSSDGIYVEAIHTDGGVLGQGIGSAIADADFFPNGGISQPGCLTSFCHHKRAWELFASSVTYDHFLGRECSNMLQVSLNICHGKIFKMGNDDIRKRGLANYLYSATAVSLKHVDNKYSRFIKYSDHDGVMHTVDLEEQLDTELLEDLFRNPDNNRYLLYTRNNPVVSQTLRLNNTNSITLSQFDARNPTVVIVHGWLNDQHTKLNIVLTDAFLRKSNVNVIVMEWRRLALSNYVTATAGVPAVGRRLGQFLEFLHSVTGAPFETMHIVGFSLGAHVVGNAGRELGGRVARITGLDPAGPLWNLNSNRLRASDAIYVEAMHTDGGVLGLGIGSAVADADFFPNGGTSQPGCLTSLCHHDRAWQLFASSVTYNHFLGRECSNRLQVSLNSCRGQILNMGNDDLSKKGSGLYRLNTQRSYPY